MKVTKSVIIILLSVLTIGGIYTISSTISLKSQQLSAMENQKSLTTDKLAYHP